MHFGRDCGERMDGGGGGLGRIIRSTAREQHNLRYVGGAENGNNILASSADVLRGNKNRSASGSGQAEHRLISISLRFLGEEAEWKMTVNKLEVARAWAASC